MKAQYGRHITTGKWYAQTDIPFVTQWGDTEQEAKDRLNAYLQKHFNLAVVNWQPFLKPEEDA